MADSASAHVPAGVRAVPQGAHATDYKKMYERTSALANIGVWEFDLVTETLTWTDAVYDLFELPRGVPVRRPDILKLYDKSSRLEMERLRSQAIAVGGSFDMDILIRTPTGLEKWLHLTADVEQVDGKSVRIFGTKQDITERKAAQEKLRLLQAELLHVSGRRAMGTMAETLAHELNQPLAAISNYATGVRRVARADGASETLIEGLAQIEHNALRAGEIIRRMRRIAKRGDASPEVFELCAPLRSAAGLAAMGRGVSVGFDLRHTTEVLADSVQIEQVVINLVKNACEAVLGSEERIVTVATEDRKDFVVVSIADTGPGLPAGLNLFEASNSSKPNGMGIGLSVCRTIVEANGGRIWAESAPGGARLSFSIPRYDG